MKSESLHDHPSLIIPLNRKSSILLERRKGSNPNQRREPAVKCPICNKFLYSVRDATVRNKILTFDQRDPQYSSLAADYYTRCSRCHHMIGIVYLNTHLRRKLGLPLLHEKQNIV